MTADNAPEQLRAAINTLEKVAADRTLMKGLTPEEYARLLRAAGVAAVYTPKHFELNRIMADIVRIVDAGTAKAA